MLVEQTDFFRLEETVNTDFSCIVCNYRKGWLEAGTPTANNYCLFLSTHWTPILRGCTNWRVSEINPLLCDIRQPKPALHVPIGAVRVVG